MPEARVGLVLLSRPGHERLSVLHCWVVDPTVAHTDPIAMELILRGHETPLATRVIYIPSIVEPHPSPDGCSSSVLKHASEASGLGVLPKGDKLLPKGVEGGHAF